MTTPNTPANGGQILTDERIYELWSNSWNAAIAEAGMCIGNADVAHMNQPRHLAKAIEADFRASLAAPAEVVYQVKQHGWSSMWMDASKVEYDACDSEKRVFAAPAIPLLVRIRDAISTDRCDGSSSYAHGVNAAVARHIEMIDAICAEVGVARAIPTVDRNATLWTHKLKDGTGYGSFIYDDKERAERSQVFNPARDNYELVGLVEVAAQPAAQVAVSDDQRDAARWRAFAGSARIRIFGSAGINVPEPTYGRDYSADLLKQMDDANDYARELLAKYADIAIEAQRATPATVKTAETK